MKKICILKGSPRKQGNTNALVSILKQSLQESGYQILEFELYDMDIKPCIVCRGCQKDWSSAQCVQDDDMKMIFKAIMESELIILATPIYSWYYTPPMKAALDRLVYSMNMYYGDERGPSLRIIYVAVITNRSLYKNVAIKNVVIRNRRVQKCYLK